MKKENEPQADTRAPEAINAAQCWLMGRLNEEWGPATSAEGELHSLQGSPENQTIVRFPRPMKRGAKVRRGPCAQVIQLPTPLIGDDLRSEWSWIRDNHHKWDNEEMSGRHDEATWRFRYYFLQGVRQQQGRPALDDSELRKEIARCRRIIEERNRIKAWLAARGVDLSTVTSPDQALAHMFNLVEAKS